MALIVQKYGGSSVADIDRIRNVANRVAEYRQRGDQVVVVVSAMKGVTDNLIDMAKSLMPVPSEREMASRTRTKAEHPQDKYRWEVSVEGIWHAWFIRGR